MKNCIQLHEKNAAIVTAACCTLHNLLIRERPGAYLGRSAPQAVHHMPSDVWQELDVLDSLQHLRGHTDYHMGQAIRDHLKCYVNSVGVVEWQDRGVDANPVSIGLALDIDIEI